MRAVDATFPIDFLKGHDGAVERAASMEQSGEAVAIPAPALVEVLIGGHFVGDALLRKTLALVERFEVLAADAAVAHEAGRLGAEMRRRGRRLSAADLLVAASCVDRGLILVTRDEAFSGIPGLAVEAY